MIWTISVSLPSSLCTLIIYEEIAKVPKVFVVCSYLCITHSHLYLLTFFKPFLLPSVPFLLLIHLLHITQLPKFRLCGQMSLFNVTSKLIFFTESYMMLMGYLMKIVVITHQNFSYCRAVLTHSQGLFRFLCCPAGGEARGVPGPGGGHSQDSWPRLSQENIIYDEPCFPGSG